MHKYTERGDRKEVRAALYEKNVISFANNSTVLDREWERDTQRKRVWKFKLKLILKMFIEANGMETLLFIFLFFISYSLEFCVKKEEIGKKENFRSIFYG